MEALTKTAPPQMKTYLSRLAELYGQIKSQGFSVYGIDGCLWLIGVSEKWLEDYGGPEKLMHLLFHLKRPRSKCQIEELDSLKREPPLVNLAVHNMGYVMSRSPLVWYPKDFVLDVIMGRVFVFAQFEIEGFFQLARNAGLEPWLITGKQVESYMRSENPLLENSNAYGVRVKFSNGRIMSFRPSLFRSVYSNFVLPSELLRLIKIVDESQRTVT